MGRGILTLLATHLFVILAFSASSSPGPVPPGPGLFPGTPGYVTTDFPWPSFHHDQANTGFTWAVAPASNSLLWSLATGGPVSSSPVVGDGVVYFGSSDAKLYAVNESSGGVLWTWTTGGAITASPALANGLLYAGSQDRVLYALNPITGQMVWSSAQIAPLSSSPTPADGLLFFGTQYSTTAGTAEAVALNATTGATRWTYNWPASITSSPAVDQGKVFYGTNNGFMLALDELSGRLLWQYQAGTTTVSSAAVSAGSLFATTASNRAVSLNETTGGVRWVQSFGGTANPAPSSPALANGILFFGTGRNQVNALNATTGVLIWTYATAGPVTSSPALTVDTVLVGSNDRNLYAISLASGRLKWTVSTGSAVQSSPALADALVFFGSQDWKMYAVGPPVPFLQIAMGLSRTWLRATLNTIVTVTVTSGGFPQNALLTVIASMGNVTPPVYQGNGVYLVEYTAPSIGTTSIATITAYADEPGFLSTMAFSTLTIQPPTPLTATLTATSHSVGPADNSKLTLQLTNGTQPVTGAQVWAQSTMGGNFSSVTELGNGTYTFTFNPPRKDFPTPTSTTILVEASKPGLTPATSSVQLVLFGSLPRPIVIPELPLVPIILVGLGISATACTTFLVKRRKGEKPRLLEKNLEFRNAFLKAVDNASEVVGPNVWNSILQTLEVRHMLIRERLLDRIEEFHEGLLETLGQGSSIIERLILERLYTELGYPPPARNQEDFVTRIGRAQAEFLYAKKRG